MATTTRGIAGPELRRQAITTAEANILRATECGLPFLRGYMGRKHYLEGDPQVPGDIGENGRLQIMKKVHITNGGEL